MGKVTINLYGVVAKIAGEKTTTVEAKTLKEAINALTEKYGESFKEKIYDNKGKLLRFLNIYVNGKDIRFLKNLETELSDRDAVSLIPAVGGG